MSDYDISAQIVKSLDWGGILVDLLPGGIGVYELGGQQEIQTLYANEGIARLLEGYSMEEVKEISHHAEKLIYEKDMPLLKDAVIKAQQEHKPVDCNVRYHRTPDKIGWLWIRGEEIHRRDNGNILFFALLIDANRQKTMERNLLLQQERYRILEDTSSEVLFEIDPQKDEMSYSVKELDGTLSRKVIPDYMASLDTDPLVHPSSMQEFRQHLDRAMESPSEGHFEYLSKISGRGYEWHRLIYKSVSDASGHVISVFGRTKNVHDEVLKRQIIHSQSNIDQMTNLYNNNFLVSQINEKMKNSSDECKHTLVLVSINHFSKIVEQNGHSCGDTVIQKVSSLFQQSVVSLGLFGRKGNEKFMAYMENIDDEIIDNKMQDFLSLLMLPENKVADITIECSAGAATVVGSIDYDELYEKVDEALYLAKITKDTNYIRVS